MNENRPPNLRFSDFLHDLRKADPLFWIGAAIVVLILVARYFTR